MDGGCTCGRVRYRIEGEPIFAHCCHCRQCQKLSGSAFVMNALIERDRVQVTAGADALGDETGQGRCRDCHTLLWGTHRVFGDGILFLRAGTLDEGDRIAPGAHFFVRSKHGWVIVPEGTPSFETLPGPGDPPLFGPEAEARIRAAGGLRLAPEASGG
jgi:hypothetical protein